MASLTNPVGLDEIFCFGAQQIITFPEGSSQTFTQSWLVDLGSGLVAVAGNGTGADFAAGDLILGRSTVNATGTARTALPIVVASDNTFFGLPVTSTATATTLAEAQLGTKYEVYRTSGNVFSVDTAATTNTKVIVCGFVGNVDQTVPGFQGSAWSATGESAGHAICKVIAAQRQLG